MEGRRMTSPRRIAAKLGPIHAACLDALRHAGIDGASALWVRGHARGGLSYEATRFALDDLAKAGVVVRRDEGRVVNWRVAQ